MGYFLQTLGAAKKQVLGNSSSADSTTLRTTANIAHQPTQVCLLPKISMDRWDTNLASHGLPTLKQARQLWVADRQIWQSLHSRTEIIIHSLSKRYLISIYMKYNLFPNFHISCMIYCLKSINLEKKMKKVRIEQT